MEALAVWAQELTQLTAERVVAERVPDTVDRYLRAREGGAERDPFKPALINAVWQLAAKATVDLSMTRLRPGKKLLIADVHLALVQALKENTYVLPECVLSELTIDNGKEDEDEDEDEEAESSDEELQLCEEKLYKLARYLNQKSRDIQAPPFGSRSLIGHAGRVRKREMIPAIKEVHARKKARKILLSNEDNVLTREKQAMLERKMRREHALNRGNEFFSRFDMQSLYTKVETRMAPRKLNSDDKEYIKATFDEFLDCEPKDLPTWLSVPEDLLMARKKSLLDRL